jgi:hypothetical protein
VVLATKHGQLIARLLEIVRGMEHIHTTAR